MYYLPSLMSISTVTLSWRYFFNKDYGMMNHFFGSTANWFTPPYSWIMLVIITVWWCTGSTMVIYQSALASIPQDQYEAAAVDGANAIQKFISVTLPNMIYPLMYTLVTAVVASSTFSVSPISCSASTIRKPTRYSFNMFMKTPSKSRWQACPLRWRSSSVFASCA